MRGERGTALVEFALIAPLFLMIVVGIIQFGVALNYWLDLQRLANQGARYAVVNNWPTCARGSAPGTCGNYPATPAKTLQQYMKDQAITSGLNTTSSVYICYPDDNNASTAPEDIGTPVKVRIQVPFRFFSIVNLPGLTLHADVTMRLENKPTLITGEETACW
jgi:Flp pilus assembly protein TadG